MKKPLLAYISTQSCHDQLRKTQMVQSVIGRSVPVWDRVLFTDVATDWFPGEQIRVEGGIHPGQEINLSKFRNAAMSYADAHGYEYLWLMDCDFSVLKYPSCYPETFAFPSAYWEKPDTTTFDGLLPTSCLVLSRKIFGDYRYDERFGLFWQDVEFGNRLQLKHGIHQSATDAVLFHHWHPKRESFRFDEDKALYESIKASW